MEIKNAVFTVSSSGLHDCPEAKWPEYAFIGRSNVGKSSLINMLTRSKNLAKTSSKPGKTLLINHFLMDESWYIVDLPGYGFAKVSLQMREKMHRMITQYIQKRSHLACLFVLLDGRLTPQQIDRDFIQFLGEKEIPFALIFTKLDKISALKYQQNLADWKRVLSEQWEELPRMFASSSETGKGREEILSYIEEINAAFWSEGDPEDLSPSNDAAEVDDL
ncbi:MAG: ribosome biogenesis GTP-binding protein YihA/YsxC [Bacteroidales bacterium]|nr:ribosome biogenesis GTP-binding protein YihA/YsxC [Bacteroidales bacterium]MDD3166454.1 ribosome biogenesis GTP-binding protein YihA/YsxC [Bacteroidales bacterium]MDD4770164.1 ribosome biogenesis GTP-binding protein YihA/YsxC [Bacteroidales bacterium]